MLQRFFPISVLALGLCRARGVSVRVLLSRRGRGTGGKSQNFWKIQYLYCFIALNLPVQVLSCCIKMTRLGLCQL